MKTAEELSLDQGVTAERIRQMCKAGRIPGAYKVGARWFIPEDVALPERKSGRPKKKLCSPVVIDSRPTPKSEVLGLSFPYDWPNPLIEDNALILNVLERGIFEDICRIAVHFGVNRIKTALASLPAGIATSSWMQRMLSNIEKGFADAQRVSA